MFVYRCVAGLRLHSKAKVYVLVIGVGAMHDFATGHFLNTNVTKDKWRPNCHPEPKAKGLVLRIARRSFARNGILRRFAPQNDILGGLGAPFVVEI